MLKFLILLVAFYLILNYAKKFFLAPFNKPNEKPPRNNMHFNRRRRQDFSQIEDADFEDLTDNEDQ